MNFDVHRKAILDAVLNVLANPTVMVSRRVFFDLQPIVMVSSPPPRPVQSTARRNHCRASACRTRVTGSNAKKAASGSVNSDPDPERRHTFPLAFTGFDAASLGGAAL